jgi:FKBP-type peptidyl-prolyl cis-trans isomerase SlpA
MTPQHPSETGHDQIVPGSRITLHLSLSLPDGTEAVSTFGEDPETLTLGDGTLVQGLELALYGLRAGDEQTLTLTPDQAFGLRDPDKIHPMARADFPPEITPEPGSVIGFTTPSGEEVGGTVLELDDQRAVVDFNHPLAGHEVVFRVRILSVDNP